MNSMAKPIKLSRHLLPMLLDTLGSHAEIRALFSVLSGESRYADRRNIMQQVRHAVRHAKAAPKIEIEWMLQELYSLPPLLSRCPGMSTWPKAEDKHPLARLLWSPVGQRTRLAGWLSQLQQVFKQELFALVSKGQYCGRICAVAAVAAEVFVIECFLAEGIPLWEPL